MHGPTVGALRTAACRCSLCAAEGPDAPIARAMLTSIRGASEDANVCSPFAVSPPALPSEARLTIRRLARSHGLDAIRWWPPNQGDFLVEGLPLSVRQLSRELERALGCKVAIYLAECLASDTRERLLRETVDLLSVDSA